MGQAQLSQQEPALLPQAWEWELGRVVGRDPTAPALEQANWVLASRGLVPLPGE
jgi:hypothetical protein